MCKKTTKKKRKEKKRKKKRNKEREKKQGSGRKNMNQIFDISNKIKIKKLKN